LGHVTLASLLELADGARARSCWDEALASYRAALLVVSPSDTVARATIYASMAHAKRQQGKVREAELNYEKALEADGGRREVLDALVELATLSKEPRRAVDWRRRRLRTTSGADERAAELLALARIHADEIGDLGAALDALEEAHGAAPHDRAVVRALLDACEGAARSKRADPNDNEARPLWARVVELRSELADITPDAAERSVLRAAAADIALGRLRDEQRGLVLLEQALEEDASNDRALSALTAVRAARDEWPALDATLSRLAERLARLGDSDRAWDAYRRLAALRRDRTRDLAGAIDAVASALGCKPGDVDSRAVLADLHLARGDEGRALAELERVAEIAPTRASAYARLFGLHQRAGRTDRAWLAVTALEELGAADLDQQIVADQYRTGAPIRPARSLDDAAWDELLRAPGADDVVADVLRAIVDAAAAAHVDELRERKQLVALDPARRQSAASTVSAVRSIQWAAKVLGVGAPELYVLDAVPGGIAAVQAAAPSTALGPDVLRGLTVQELAFLAGRHLTYYRPEHYALVHYPTIPELSALFLGAVTVALPLPVPPQLAEPVARRRKLLARHLDGASRARLDGAVRRLDARDGRADLAAWAKGVELTAQRAGLLLCGDLLAAAKCLRAETRTIADLSQEEKRADLVAFCATEKLARARASLEVDARTDVASPERERQVG
jgi:tetratricopeptide (TPR) repeat protein